MVGDNISKDVGIVKPEVVVNTENGIEEEEDGIQPQDGISNIETKYSRLHFF